MIYESNGIVVENVFLHNAVEIETAYDYAGIEVYQSKYKPKSEYEKALFSAVNDWKSLRTEQVVPLVIHTDQHTYLRNNKIFEILSKMEAFDGISACLNLGDVTDYNVSNFQAMTQALSYIPKDKQINLWGNHETWIQQIDMTPPYRTVTAEELSILNQYFDNSAYGGIQHTYNDYGIQYLIDNTNKIKYVVLSGWEYDTQLGSYNYYVIGSQSMDNVISMLSTVDDYDIVIISHIQPFYELYSSSLWTHPPVEPETQQGGGSMSYNVVCTATNVLIDNLLNARKNKTSGTIADSYGNMHTFDFSSCTSDLLCCLAGHEHIDKYAWGNNGTIPVYIFDGYGFDNHPIYFANIDKQQQKIELWKIDETPHIYNFSIPFAKPNI